jgi:excisionase family DNA binding protein
LADVFKKQTVRYYTPDGKRCAPETPGASKSVEESRKWYGSVNGKHVPLCRDKGASQKLLNKLLTDATMRAHGVGDPYAEHRKRPLADHLADFRAALKAKGNTPEYVALVLGRLEALAAGCGWRFPDDLSMSQADEWLDKQRGEAPAELPPNPEEYTPRAVAKLLGVSLAAVRDAVKRHKLQATGKGRKRRLPRATVEALLARRGDGMSAQTRNYYRAHLRTFGNWLVKDKRIGENPFRHLEAENTTTDRRHDRRELEADELRRVLLAARDSTWTFRGLDGRDRFHLYATACGTGFRAAALASLTPESFDLDAEQPIVTLAARKNKSRKLKVQPLPADVADLLRVYLADRPAGQPIWGGTWAADHRGAEMLRGDLDAAGVPYAVEGPDGPLFADFHALRHSYLTLGGRAGIDLRTLQELAGHSTPVLTARYSHRRLYDLAGAVEKLPSFLPSGEEGQEAQTLQATGTDGAIVVRESGDMGFGCTLVARTPCNQGHLQASSGTEAGGNEEAQKRHNPVTGQRVASPGISSHQRGRRDSNPQPPDRQLSSCLGYIPLQFKRLRRLRAVPTRSMLSTVYAVFPWFPGILWQIVWHSLAPRAAVALQAGGLAKTSGLHSPRASASAGPLRAPQGLGLMLLVAGTAGLFLPRERFLRWWQEGRP